MCRLKHIADFCICQDCGRSFSADNGCNIKLACKFDRHGVGTILETYFSHLKWLVLLKGSCGNCMSLKQKLNVLELSALEKNKKEIIRLIQQNAKKYNRYVPRIVLWVFVSLAIERAKRLAA